MTSKLPDVTATSRTAQQRAERAAMLEQLRQRMVADDTISGGTMVFTDGETVYVARADLMRWPPRADA